MILTANTLKPAHSPFVLLFIKTCYRLILYTLMQRQDQIQLFTTEAANGLAAESAARPRYARSWPLLASIVLHGIVFFLLLLVDAGEPVGVADAGGAGLSVFEVGLASLPSGLGQNTAPPDQDMLTEPPSEQKRQPESASMPEDATPIRLERPPKNGQQATRARQAKQLQRPQQATLVSGAQGEDGVDGAGLSGVPDQPAGKNGSGTLTTPDTVSGDGRPFGFSLGEVNGKPKVIKSVSVVYPVEARKKGITGQVLVRFHLDEKGTLSHLHIKNAEPPDIFNQNTLAALRQWRFQPAIHNSKAVPVWVELPLEFHLR